MSRFGLRRKLKQILGMVDPPIDITPADPVRTPSPPPATKKPIPVESTPTPTTSSSEQENPDSDSAQTPSEQDEKILKHRRRTKIALLKLTVKSDGTASLGDLHDLAEKRYFIAHKAFSDLMEEMVAEGLFLYDWNAGEATLTELGREWVQNDSKGGKK